MAAALLVAPLVVLLAALLSAVPARAQSTNDHRIVPWERIGPIALGMSDADVFRIMGDPTKTMGGPPNGVDVYTWKDDLSVTVKHRGGYVTQVCALSPAYVTAQGVRPGQSEVSVTALMGEPQNAKIYPGWWKQSYTDLTWGGLTVNIPLTGFNSNHAVRAVCVNHNA